MNFWDRISGLYDFAESLNGSVYRRMTANIEKLVPNGAKVLDCAAGTGQLSIAASKNADSVLCTDMSLKMLERAQKKARQNGIRNIDFASRDVTALPDADESYDVVIAGNVLHLLDRPQDAVAELMRVTKKGGLVILPTFMVKKNPLVKIYGLIGFNPSKDYTPDTYCRMVAKASRRRLKVKLINGMIPNCFVYFVK